MPSDGEARVLRLEADLARLEGRITLDEARAALLEQGKPIPPQAGGEPSSFPFPVVINEHVTLQGQASNALGGTTVTVKDATGATLHADTTDTWGYVQYWFNIDGPAEDGKTYSIVFAHAGYVTETYTFVIDWLTGRGYYSSGISPSGQRHYAIELNP